MWGDLGPYVTLVRASFTMRAPSAMSARQANSDRRSTAVGYLRRSTSQQEQSIPDQRAAIERYAAQHHLQLIHFYTDDAITGTRTKGRKAFQAMMAAAQRGDCEFGVVIVYDIKRFGRVDNDEAGHYRYVLRTHGVEVRYVSEHFTGHSTDDLLRAVKQWQAREESKDLSKVTIRGLLSKVASSQAEGCWMGGVPPFGYDLRYEKLSGAFMFHVRHMRDRTKQLYDESWKPLRTLGRGQSPALTKQDHCRLVLSCQARVNTVREIYRLYLEERRGFAAIADRFNRLGVPTIRGTNWSNKCGGRWTCSAIRQILTNPTYVGDLAWNRRTHGKINQIRNGEAVERTDALIRKSRHNDELDWIIVQDTHPPIVSRYVWERSNWLIRERSQVFLKEIHDTGLPKLNLLRRMSFRWTGPPARFLLSQLATCAHCGSRYEGCVVQNTRRKPQGKREHEYLCGGWNRGRRMCKKGAIPQHSLEAVVIKQVVEFYKRYRGCRGRSRCLQAIRPSVVLEERTVAVIRRRLRAKITELDQAHLDPAPGSDSGKTNIASRNPNTQDRKRALLERRLESLDYIALSEDEIPELLDRMQIFVEELHEILRGRDQEERLAAIRRCVVGITVDAVSQRAQIELRDVPTILSVLDVGPTPTVRVNLAHEPRDRTDISPSSTHDICPIGPLT